MLASVTGAITLPLEVVSRERNRDRYALVVKRDDRLTFEPLNLVLQDWFLSSAGSRWRSYHRDCPRRVDNVLKVKGTKTFKILNLTHEGQAVGLPLVLF